MAAVILIQQRLNMAIVLVTTNMHLLRWNVSQFVPTSLQYVTRLHNKEECRISGNAPSCVSWWGLNRQRHARNGKMTQWTMLGFWIKKNNITITQFLLENWQIHCEEQTLLNLSNFFYSKRSVKSNGVNGLNWGLLLDKTVRDG